MYTYDTGLIRLRYTVTDTYRVVKSAGYTLNSSENEFKFMALQSWRVNSMNSYSTCRVTTSGCRIERIADEGGARHVLVLHSLVQL